MNKPHLNKEFEKHFIKLENYIKENIDFRLIEKKFFYKRFAQQIWENSSYLRYSPYLDINSLKKSNKFKNNPKYLNIMPGYIRLSDGRFILGFSSFLKIFLIYLANLFYFAIMIIISIFNIKKKVTYNVLFYSFKRTTLKRLVNDLFDFSDCISILFRELFPIDFLDLIDLPKADLEPDLGDSMDLSKFPLFSMFRV